MGPIDLLSLLA